MPKSVAILKGIDVVKLALVLNLCQPSCCEQSERLILHEPSANKLEKAASICDQVFVVVGQV